jgi:hypothetical protein
MGTAGLTRLRLLYPWPLLLQQHTGLAFGEEMGTTLSQALLYLQFPLYALLLMLIRRFKSFPMALGLLIVLHLGAAAALWLLPAR